MHRTGSFYALLMCGLLDATTEWIGGRQKEREKTIRNGIRSSRLSTCCHFRLLAVCVYRYTAIGFFFFVFFSHWISQRKLSTWARICYRFREKKIWCIYKCGLIDCKRIHTPSFSLSHIETCGTSHWRDKRHIQCHTLRFNRRYFRLAAAAAAAVADVCFLRCCSHWIHPKKNFSSFQYVPYKILLLVCISYLCGLSHCVFRGFVCCCCFLFLFFFRIILHTVRKFCERIFEYEISENVVRFVFRMW